MGKKGPLCAWDLASPQGTLTPPLPQLLPSMGLLGLRLVTQKWTRSTSWLANGRWQAVQATGRERCFSPRQGRHSRWPQGSWYTGSFLKYGENTLLQEAHSGPGMLPGCSGKSGRKIGQG